MRLLFITIAKSWSLGMVKWRWVLLNNRIEFLFLFFFDGGGLCPCPVSVLIFSHKKWNRFNHSRMSIIDSLSNDQTSQNINTWWSLHQEKPYTSETTACKRKPKKIRNQQPLDNIEMTQCWRNIKTETILEQTREKIDDFCSWLEP